MKSDFNSKCLIILSFLAFAALVITFSLDMTLGVITAIVIAIAALAIFISGHIIDRVFDHFR